MDKILSNLFMDAVMAQFNGPHTTSKQEDTEVIVQLALQYRAANRALDTFGRAVQTVIRDSRRESLNAEQSSITQP